MRLKNIAYLLFMLISFLLIGCEQEKEPISVVGVTLSQTSLNMTEGDTQILTATIEPSNADNKSLSWSSNQPYVASVQDGVVTAHKAGNTIVTVKSIDGGKTAICSVTVDAKVIIVTGVSLDKTSLELIEGDEITITATITPDNATNKNVTWTSSDESVATIKNGKVTAVKEGTTTITVTTEDGGKAATCEVTVNSKVIPVEGVSLDRSSVELIEGESFSLTAIVTPNNASNKAMTWSSSDESVAIVDRGTVIAIKEGTTTITVTTEDGGKAATCEVKVIHDSSNDAILFADAVMKEMCVNAFDTNGDGELSFVEARNVTNLSEMTLTKKTFKSFNEFQYFINVKTIPSYYFQYSNIESITLHENVREVGNGAFYECLKLGHINLPDNISFIGSDAFKNCMSLSGVIDLPKNITEISRAVFSGCTNLKEVNIKEGVTSIEVQAFRDCSSLMRINIPEGVTSIGGSCFSGCSSLMSINIPEGVTCIESGCFYNCSSLTNINNIPEGVTRFGDSCFSGCSSLTSINIPEGVTRIENECFKGCSSLTSINIPEGVTSIGGSCFYGCSSLMSINIPESVTSIGEFAFGYCSSLMRINIPEGVTRFGDSCFSGCSSLTSINIPEGVTRIEDHCFNECSSLTSITIPENVTYIGGYCFFRCSNLLNIYVKPVFPPKLDKTNNYMYTNFYYCAEGFKIYVSHESLKSYITADGWSELAEAIVGYDFENNNVIE